MLRRLSLLALLVAVAAIGSATPAALGQDNTATVHGTIYDLWTFTPLENVWVKALADSTVQGSTPAADGTYSLTLPPGSYTIKAEYYSDSTAVYRAEENITLQENDNLLLDLIMFPTFEEPELSENYDPLPELEEEEGVGAELPWVAFVAVVVIVVVGVIIFYHRKILGLMREAKEEAPAPPPVKEAPAPPPVRVVGLPEDLKEVLDIVRESGGRINQLELRRKLPYSEAKVSLMISDLEDRDLIRKIKKGRGNIVVLKE